MNQGEFERAARELVGVLLDGLQAIHRGDERQEFLDRAALQLMPLSRASDIAYTWAGQLWAERERLRGQPSERELVVRWLNRLHQDEDSGWGTTLEPGWKIGDLADAIKAGKHLEPSGG